MKDGNEANLIDIIEVTSYSESVLDDVNKLLKQLTKSPLNFSSKMFKEMLLSENSTLIVARDNSQAGKIIGTLSFATFRVPTGLNFRIEDVVVDQTARGKGVGRKLMVYAIKEAQIRGTDKIDLTSSTVRIAANQLYVSLGFKLKKTNVYRLELT